MSIFAAPAHENHSGKWDDAGNLPNRGRRHRVRVSGLGDE